MNTRLARTLIAALVAGLFAPVAGAESNAELLKKIEALSAELARLKLPGDLAVRPLAEPQLDWHVALIWQPGRYMSHAARAWLAVCAEEAALPLF